MQPNARNTHHDEDDPNHGEDTRFEPRTQHDVVHVEPGCRRLAQTTTDDGTPSDSFEGNDVSVKP